MGAAPAGGHLEKLDDGGLNSGLEGGVLDFEYSGGDIVMRGGAEYVHHGTIQDDAV